MVNEESSMQSEYIKKILKSKVYDVAIESPLDYASNLSRRLGRSVYLKREDLQPVFSFKLRGAYNKIAGLTEKELSHGVVTASAGNHAQGVALSAKGLGIDATIVMPTTTPEIKVNSVRAHGAKVVLHGDTFDQAYELSQKLVAEKGMYYVHPYDDPEVIAGQGTVGMEILQQHTAPIKAIFVPVGGGGLIAGVAIYVKYLCPEIKVIGVEPEDSACLAAALRDGKRTRLDSVGIFADGVAVRQVGEENYRVLKGHVDEVVTVTTDEICAAVKDIFDDTRSISEPAGALSVAGLKRYLNDNKVDEDENLVAIVSGANVNFDRLRHVAERAELGEKREAILAVTIPEKPGSFLRFCNALGKRSITELNYRYADDDSAHIFVGVQLQSREEELAMLLASLKHESYPVVDMTDNEMAKLHIRHMVGGRSPAQFTELLFRFEFPERPGALLNFLTALGARWNISMFHYRNHGAAFGRVLVGLQAEASERQGIIGCLDALGYAYWEETDNPAFKLFLD